MKGGEIIVSYRSIRRGLEAGVTPVGGFESASAPPEADITRVTQSIRDELARPGPGLGTVASPEEVVEWTARLSDALAKFEAAETHPDVLNSPQDETASLVQSFLAARAAELQSAREAAAGGFEAKFDDHDIAGCVGSLVSWIRGLKRHAWQPPPDGPEAVADGLRVAVLGDWGTGLYGAPACARSIRKDPKGYGLLLHLGDVYYAGTESEVDARFLSLWPKVSGAVSRALNSNNEMYSGGRAYFNKTLFGRCVGHSGYPYFRTRLKDALRVQGDAAAGWYRLSAKNLVPGGLLLDGSNPYLADHLNDYGPNGYATLEFEGEHLTEVRA